MLYDLVVVIMIAGSLVWIICIYKGEKHIYRVRHAAHETRLRNETIAANWREFQMRKANGKSMDNR